MSEEFLGLRLEEVLELVGCDELNVKAEEQVSATVSPSTPLWAHTSIEAPILPTLHACKSFSLYSVEWLAGMHVLHLIYCTFVCLQPVLINNEKKKKTL